MPTYISYTDVADVERTKALISRGEAHTGAIKCIDFSPVQTNLLASAGTKGEFFVWDTSKTPATSTSYKSTRLDDIISIAWNNKVGHIIALGGKGGALSVWDLRKKSELIHIPTRFPVTSVAWHPSESTILMTASGDDLNPVVQTWDLRNANAPRVTLVGHEKAVLSLAWCLKDPELLLTSGADNRTLIWNPTKAEIVAELPASSQWVHKVAWCKQQPSIIAHASLDGKICMSSIQDTSAPVASAPVLDEGPAGDDFFDQIPKNYQAQTASFTLKQTPRWLKRPNSAKFGFLGKMASFGPKSTKVEISTHHISGPGIPNATKLKSVLASQSIAELCETARAECQKDEKADWDIIETLASEEPRDALLKHLGFTKEVIEKEVVAELGNVTEEHASSGTQEMSHIQEKKEENDENNVFGDDADDDEFLGSLGSSVAANSVANGKDFRSDTKKPAFDIFSTDSANADNLITKAILTGQFETAIDVCLKEDRMSDAFMLALCGGAESQKRVQKAYFSKTSVPYGRLLSSIINGDLWDVVNRASLSSWKEILAILCNYAKPADFSDLCEALGSRLESETSDTAHATLCYLAGSRLDRLLPIWAACQAKHENDRTQDSAKSAFEAHALELSGLIRKVTIFRKAVSYKDEHNKFGDRFKLELLYERYIEFSGLLTAEGDLLLANEYLALIPNSFPGVDALKKRLQGPPKPIIPATNSAQGTPRRPTGLRNVFTQPQGVPEQKLNERPTASSSYAPIASANSNVNLSAAPTAPASQSNASTYASSPSTAPVHNPYAPIASQNIQPSPYQTGYQQNAYGIQASQHTAPVPPPRTNPAGPPILPAAQRKDITPWNDAPDVPMAVSRRPTPTVMNRSTITSPFPNQPSPTLQGFGPAALPPLAPPPKTRSPALAKPSQQPPAASFQAPPKTVTPSQYAPVVSAELPAMGPSQGHPYAGSPQAPGTLPTRYPAAIATQPSSVPPQQPPQTTNFAPPPRPVQTTQFAPPPKSLGNKIAGINDPGSPVIKSPTITRGVALSREPSGSGQIEDVSRPSPPVSQYPAGDRTHISESNLPIFQNLSEEVARLRASAVEKYRRPLEDTDRRLNLMFDQLNNNQLTDGTLEQLKSLSGSIKKKDWQKAYVVQLELTTDKMHECREWISATKTMIIVGKNVG